MRADWCSRRSASVSGTRNVICCCSTPTFAAAARIASTDVAVGFVLFVFFIGTFRFLVLLFPAAARKIPVAAVGEYQTTGSERCVLERAPRFVACRATAPGKERLRSPSESSVVRENVVGRRRLLLIVVQRSQRGKRAGLRQSNSVSRLSFPLDFLSSSVSLSDLCGKKPDRRKAA